MTNTNTPGKKGLSRRKAYAAQCFLRGRTGTRAFDNCFENGDGDEVVRHLMKRAAYATPGRLLWADNQERQGVIIGSLEHREIKKIRNAHRLREGIKRSGSWEYWSYFVEHGTYVGFGR